MTPRSVRLARSVPPSVWGCFEDARATREPNRSHKEVQRVLSNWAPLSETIRRGNPCLAITWVRRSSTVPSAERWSLQPTHQT